MTPGGGELRRNPASGRLSIVAPARASRPAGASGPGAGAPPCPFCAGNEALTPPEVDAVRPGGGAPDGPGWRVRVVPNKYPALDGRHEVIVHAPAHEAELEDLGDDASRRGPRGVAAPDRRASRVGSRRGDAHRQPRRRLGRLAGAPARAAVRDAGGAAPAARRARRGRAAPQPLRDVRGVRRAREGGRPAGAGRRRGAWVPDASRFNGELWLAPAAHEADFRAADPAAVAPALRRALTAVKASIGAARR